MKKGYLIIASLLSLLISTSSAKFFEKNNMGPIYRDPAGLYNLRNQGRNDDPTY